MARHTHPDAEPLASFPNLESLEFHGCDRQFNSHPCNSEWWFMVPAVTGEGQLPVCLLSRVLLVSAQVGQHSFYGHLVQLRNTLHRLSRR